ncbi:MAG: hypothetical protein JWR90_3385 [Marmoricola sp.]|nr:hypothetical protein [Marmoricola sp.]
MAKKNERDNRRAIAEQMRKEQQRKERRRSLLILGGCVVLVVGLLTAALVPYIKNQRAESKAAGTPISDLGVSTTAAKCEPVKKVDASGNGTHITIGKAIKYAQSPPSYGPHWANFLQGSEIRNFYTTQDRPEIERMVHSLEHGHTILWYDAETVKPGTKDYKLVKAISAKFDADAYFMAAPWSTSDGGAFPAGEHIALTHWTGPQKQLGVTQFCAAPSGAVVKKFTDTYQPDNAPEPGAA